jgi:hypothetical protein
MPRLLVGDAYFEVVDSTSWYERDFESLIVARSQRIFPRWRCVQFTATVEGDDGTRKKPDLALIDEQYREWWVVEVELSHHDLYGHVVPQVQAFKTGLYGLTHVNELSKRAPELNKERLAGMMLGAAPGILVVVDSPSTNWRAPLNSMGVELAIAEPFRSPAQETVLRLNGFQPEPPGDVLTRCIRHRMVRRLWRVQSPAAIPLPQDGLLSIEYEGNVATWRVVTLSDAVMLQPERGDLLGSASTVDLTMRSDGTLEFVPAQRGKRTRR